MNSPVISKIVFTVTFPARNRRRIHIPLLKLHSLARKQLSDLEVIETIDHLFNCPRCLENYRLVRSAYPEVWS